MVTKAAIAEMVSPWMRAGGNVLSTARNIKMAYDIGVWMGGQVRTMGLPRGGGITQENLVRAGLVSDNPGHSIEPAPDVSALLCALSGELGVRSKKKKKPSRYNMLMKQEMAKLKHSKKYTGKARFKLAVVRASRALKKEKKNGRTKAHK